MTRETLLQEVLGFSSRAEGGENASLLRVPMKSADFPKVLSYWCSLDKDQLPTLLGISVEPNAGAKFFFNIILSPRGQGALVCVEVEYSPKDSLPDLTTIWPHSAWWQEEFSVFASAPFSQDKNLGEIKWRQA